MVERPHDISDLYLAPVVLEIDSRLERLGSMSEEEVKFDVVLDTNRDAERAEERSHLVLLALIRNVDLHGWSVSWDPRGLRLAHGKHALTLGLPASVRDYVGS